MNEELKFLGKLKKGGGVGLVGGGGGVRVDKNSELKFLGKLKKKYKKNLGGGGVGSWGGGGQGGFERRIEVFVKIQKIIFLGGYRGGVRWGVGLVGGGRVDVNEELKFLGKFKKKRFFFGGGGSGWWWGGGGGSGWIRT